MHLLYRGLQASLALAAALIILAGYGSKATAPTTFYSAAPSTSLSGEIKGVNTLEDIVGLPAVFTAPARLSIPSLHIDAAVQAMGLTKQGNMEVPANIAEAGWYKFGANPGNTGTAVIAGHLDGKRGEPGIFFHLDRLRLGDTFSITDASGQVAHFKVREIKTYEQNTRPAEVFTSADGKHLNLITCAGDWDTGVHRYQKRLVVFGDLLTAD